MSEDRVSETFYEDEQTIEALKQFAITAGSMSEGAAICRYASHEVPHLEVDIMCTFAHLVEMNRHILEPVGNRPGYYNIKNNANILHNSIMPLTKLQALFVRWQKEEIIDDEYFTGLKFKQLVAEEETMNQKITIARGHKCTAGYGFYKYFEEKYPTQKVTLNYSSSFEGPSLVVSYTVLVHETPVFIWSCDRVGTIFLDLWPSNASEFPDRNREWPNPGQIAKVVSQGCHLVAKESIAWRISFSVAETELNKLRTEEMKLVYIIAKSIFYVYIKPVNVDDHHVPSYALKTVMMWEQEKHKTSFWSTDNIEQNLSKLFFILSEALRKGVLPSYFLPSLNVIADKPRELLSEASVIAQRVVNEPLRFAAESIKVMDIDTLPERLDVINWLYEHIDLTLTDKYDS